MKAVLTLAQKEVMAAFRDKIFLIIVGLFVLLSIVSVYIGSSTKNAEMQAYQNIVELLKAQGKVIFPTPPEIFPLSILQNIITYVSMIGAVVAIFLGYEAFNGERNQGTLKLIATRAIYRDQIVTGKLLGGGMVLGLLLGIILIFNLTLFILISGLSPDINEIIRLLTFFMLALIYLMFFYTTTLFVSIKTNNSEFGFLLMMVVWITLSFVVPQLAESQRSFAYTLNATAQTVTQVPTDTLISRTIELFSPTVQFQNISKDLLQVTSETATIAVWKILEKKAGALVNILLPGIVLLIMSYRAAQKEEVS
ncbi:ABC transporter permease [Acetobacterium woodii]|uniref:ABC transport system permease protein n=1 Tax=Acetobacterium woodii (strain ATCC 29683 / DSM 1030 / JCM 2381 / KCTC 1655 / WB1) TaxID=931626 RepID=H6LFJ6_ACEWD|nr:ABC transporter permease subunit [Acetobacterium woodii]AFA49483.1 ABC transport system permease protein [Acetobacterium woodii DSM 1030]